MRSIQEVRDLRIKDVLDRVEIGEDDELDDAIECTGIGRHGNLRLVLDDRRYHHLDARVDDHAGVAEEPRGHGLPHRRAERVIGERGRTPRGSRRTRGHEQRHEQRDSRYQL